MKVLLTGAAGQLGRALMASKPAHVNALGVDREEMDLTDPNLIRRTLERETPALVISAGAYTAVDQAESERDVACAVNSVAPGVIAEVCREIGARLIHISTDFVFDGAQGSPYRPSDAPAPLNVYGASKLEGERRIAAVHGLDWCVIRTAWVYAAQGRNFLLTMLRLFSERATVNVVCDQIGAPTSARSLAQCVWRAAALEHGGSAVLHFTNAGAASWYDFAVAIYEEARVLGLIQREVAIHPIVTEQYPTPARRPAFSVLATHSSLAQLGLAPVHWRVELRAVMKEIVR